MMKFGRIRIGVIAGLAVILAACGPAESGPVPVTGAEPTSSNVPVAEPGTADPASSGEGTVVLRTATLSGVAVPDVPVYLSLQQPCDPAGRDIPLEGTDETRRHDAVTDADGKAVFTVATGCYHFGMTAPVGTTPVPEGMHSLFLVEPGSTVSGLLRFQDEAAVCAEDTIESELHVDTAAAATISHCDGQWAVISWDTPGDNQRILTRSSGTWTTYVAFPHQTCWAKATADGVPDRLRSYFDC